MYNDHNPNTPVAQTLSFTQPFEHIDFVGIANEIETEFAAIGINMVVSNYYPTGNVTCYKSICLGCDGNGIPTGFEVDPNTGIPTGEVSGSSSGSYIGGNGILIGDSVTDPITGVVTNGTGSWLSWTSSSNNNINPNTVVVYQNPNGPGYILQYEETEGLFAMGDVEIITILGNDEFNSVYDPITEEYITQECDPNALNGFVTMPFNHCP